MNVQERIEAYLEEHPEPKQSDLRRLHELMIRVSPGCQLWFLDGKNELGKVVSNPNIGYGFSTMNYADGSTRDFYQVGLSANKAGISVYIIGIEDKTFLANTFGPTLGKAAITGYCIRFRRLADIDVTVLEAAIRYGLVD